MRLVTLADLSAAQLDQLAELTLVSGREHAPEWLPDLAAAREEIDDARAPGKVTRIALADETPLGWIAAGRSWGRIWEIHPLLVAPSAQRRGIGRILVAEMEREATAAGALTMWVGTSDSTNATSVSNVDLYADPLAALAGIHARSPHPFQFWQRVGYRIMGIVPDAEGPGMPSISLAKRLA